MKKFKSDQTKSSPLGWVSAMKKAVTTPNKVKKDDGANRELNYLFVFNNVSCASKNDESDKEADILKFLDDEGVFQIHIQNALSQFAPLKATKV